MLLTVVFASVSFLAGMSTKMAYPRHAVVVVVGFAGFLYGIGRMVSLPFFIVVLTLMQTVAPKKADDRLPAIIKSI